MICKFLSKNYNHRKHIENTQEKESPKPIVIEVEPIEEVIEMGYMPKKTNRRIDYLVVHCTATREGQHISVDQIRTWHKNKGWSDIGYHYVIYLDGSIHEGRPATKIGAHVRGFNKYSLGITYVGGVNRDLAPRDTRTPQQKQALIHILKELKKNHPSAKIKGHRDFSPDKNNNGIIEPFEWMKACPSFDALTEYRNI